MITDLLAISFEFYHFAHIMLLHYKSGPKFAISNVGNPSDTDVRTQAMEKLCRRPSAVVNLNCVTNRVAPGSRYKLSYNARTIQDNTHSS
jgi:hypothetical protein